MTRKPTRNVCEWIDVQTKLKLNFGIEHVNRAG